MLCHGRSELAGAAGRRIGFLPEFRAGSSCHDRGRRAVGQCSSGVSKSAARRVVRVVGQRTNNAFIGTPGVRVVRCRRMRAQRANNDGANVLEFIGQFIMPRPNPPAG